VQLVQVMWGYLSGARKQSDSLKPKSSALIVHQVLAVVVAADAFLFQVAAVCSTACQGDVGVPELA
jgi:hypothetical protein